jgi:hypothetical protein
MSAGPVEDLAAELRTALERVDPLPPLVGRAARSALTWRRVDAELAELLADSADGSELLAGARRGVAAVRAVTFRAERLTIDVQISPGGDRLQTLLGQLSPPVAATVEIQQAGGATESTTTDGAGRFRSALPAGTSVRLRIRPTEGAPAQLETSWITV